MGALPLKDKANLGDVIHSTFLITAMTTALTEQYRQIHTLIGQVTNSAQRASLTKTMATTEADRIYIDTFRIATEAEGDPQRAAGMFYVLGTMNQSTRKRERYQVLMGHDGTFECSCMDFRTNCPRQQKVCKHICFVVCKFGKIYDVGFFNAAAPKALGAEARTGLLQRGAALALSGRANEVAAAADDTTLRECFIESATANGLVSNTRIEHCRGVTAAITVNSQANFTDLDAFKNWETDATCCICFDEVRKDPALTVACPKCHNVMHRACMRIWIIESRHTTCVFCRDPVWRGYKG